MKIPADSHLREPIEKIKKSAEKAATIVQDLLTLARRGLGSAELLKLNDVVSEYLGSPEFLALHRDHPEVDIDTDLADDLLPILGSPAHLSKALMNLVSNAAEAMPEGGTIRISTENRRLHRPMDAYELVEPGNYAAISVADTGTGIPKADVERIFEPFYTKKVMGRSGTGLGMAVVWGTVRDHDGFIDVHSAEHKGTTLTLYFPTVAEELVHDSPVQQPRDILGKGENLLLVDDVAEQREIGIEMLSSLGYSVEAVASGEDAVAYVHERPVDLVILDMIMEPGIDGLEAYRRIVDIRPGQKAILASGFSETERVKEAQRLGAGSYLRKPFLLNDLALAVRRELDRQ
jgi:CheY-like chemotaxis protein